MTNFDPRIHTGLQPLPEDKRDLQLGSFIGSMNYPKLTELPESFSLGDPLWIGNQGLDGNLDFCSAYASDGASQFQEGIILFPAYSFAASKNVSGDSLAWGQNLRAAMAGHTKYGALAEDDVLDADKFLDTTNRRLFDKYTEDSKEKALTHLKRSYVSTVGPYDAYDNIRSAIWMYREEKRAVVVGVIWGWNLNDYILDGTPSGNGHAMYVVGWDHDGLIIVNSAGKLAGKEGLHRITRATIEAYIPQYGAFMFLDASPDEIRRATDAQKDSGILAKVFTMLVKYDLTKYFLSFFIDYEQKKSNVTVPEPTPKISLIPSWAKAIEMHEGYGTPDAITITRNYNPGALRYSPFQIEVRDGFASFPDYATGWKALIHQLTIAATGKSKVYKPTDTLLVFFSKWAPPSNNNDPFRYAKVVADRLKVDIKTQIKDLV